MFDESHLKTIFEASYQNPSVAKSSLEEKGYKFDTEFSSPDTKVFVDVLGNPHIAYRGTHRAEDVITDVKLGLGQETKRHKEAKELAKKVEQKYGKAASAYGTSLGGHLAESSGVSGNVYTYNKATGIKDIFKTVPKTQFDYRTERDIISLPSVFQRGGKKITIGSTKNEDFLKAHSTAAFDLSKKKTIQSGNPFKNFF
jgi:hypothetical protein